MGPKPMHPSLFRAFQRHQEHDLKQPGSVDLIITNQNKLPSFIDRLFLADPHLQRSPLEINVLPKEEKIFKRKTQFK
jgi:hypothetical protein